MSSNPPTRLPQPLDLSDDRRLSVFISYSHEDVRFAKRLADDLRAAGHVCWIDSRQIKGGDEWWIEISKAIMNSDAFLPILTHKALERKWVRDEITWAKQNDKRIIPVLLEDVTTHQGFFPLAGYQGIRVFDSEYENELEKLKEALECFVSASPGASAAPNFSNRRRDLELAYLKKLVELEKLDQDKFAAMYTPLGGASQQQRQRVEMQQLFEFVPMGEDRQGLQEPKAFDDAVREIGRIRRGVLLGEPGSGKTTTICALVANLVEIALQDPAAPIPLLIRLGNWTEVDQPLSDFIASQLGDLGRAFDQLLKENRAALLLDGLNEIPSGQHKDKFPLVHSFIENRPDILAVVSCRELDYQNNRGFDLDLNRINIKPLNPDRIREFVRRYLGEEQGEELFWLLAGGDDVRETWEAWNRKALSFEQFWTATEIPSNNLDLNYGKHGRVWSEKVRSPRSMMELARNPYMLLMLISVYRKKGELPENRGGLFSEFVEILLEQRGRIPKSDQALVTDGLAQVAYKMQRRRPEDEPGNQDKIESATTILSEDLIKALTSERILYQARSAGILSVGDPVRFTHQLLQEYFAARYMEIEIRVGGLKATEIWPPECWWERNNWEEAAILLAGLSPEDCTPVVEWVAEANPEVAAMCIARSGASVPQTTLKRLSSAWIPRLTDVKNDPNPKARVAIGRALAMIDGDDRKGVGVIQIKGGKALPDIDWVEILGGEFQYGDKSDDAAVPKKLTLLTFYISRYPMTSKQFQTFLDDSEGYTNPQWFDGLSIKYYTRQLIEQSFKYTNHPRDSVNWYQAMAFCRWFSWRLGGSYDLDRVDEWVVRLPTEFEWEKAARGADGRIYPYLGEFDAVKGNTNETNIGMTSAVGIFPEGASPYGVMDLCGNVWEWCLSDVVKPAHDVRKENLQSDAHRVLRGGSWVNMRADARAIYRNYVNPYARVNDIGFRVVSLVRPPS